MVVDYQFTGPPEMPEDEEKKIREFLEHKWGIFRAVEIMKELTLSQKETILSSNSYAVYESQKAYREAVKERTLAV